MKTHLFKYDLDLDMGPGSGDLCFDEDGTVRAGHGEYNAADIEESGVIAGVGCGLIYIKMKDESEIVLCRFTMSLLKPAGEYCKIVNYYAQYGVADIPEESEKLVCEKCGRMQVEGMNTCLFCYDRKGVLYRAFGLMKPFRKRLFTVQTLLVFSSMLFLLTPLFSRFLIDNYLRPMTGDFTNVLILGLAMLAARVIGEAIFILSSRSFNKLSIMYSNHLRTLAFSKLQRLSMSSFSKRTPGDLIRRVMEDTNVIKDFIADIGRWAIEQSIFFLVAFTILMLTNWRLTLLVILPVPIVGFAMSRFWRLIIIRYERQWRKSSREQSILYDIIKGIRTVKSFGNEEREIKKFNAAAGDLARVSSNNETLWARLFPSITFFTSIGEFLVLYLGGRAILAGSPDMSLGILVQFTMYIAIIYGPLRWLVSLPRWLADAMTSMLKVFEIFDEEQEDTAGATNEDEPLSGGVVFEDVNFGYKSYEPVLKDVSIDIEKGEMIGIVGKTGVGKTTMINLLIRLYDPNTGRITIGENDLRKMSPEYLRDGLGVVFQDTFLFAGTVFDNVAYSKPGATVEEVIAACKAANAHDFIMGMSDGYNTQLGESGHSISGGERQRISIARAVIRNPDILILDEATSSLDVETEAAIQESLAQLTKGRTTIAIAHRLSTLRAANRLIVLEKGRVAEVGTHMELMKQKGIYYKLVIAQRQISSTTEEK